MMSLQAKIDYSIALMRKAEPLALSMHPDGFHLAFSGGKDNFLSAYYGVTKNFNRTYEQTAKSTDEPCGVVTTEN
ncbi:MAG: hypothetical protein LBL13_08670, partial [Bacteroidales bacterium]|nr:hypothetical protein [Bacteroidales bacterium]